MLTEVEDQEPIVSRQSRGERIQRSQAARGRRKAVKLAMESHQFKDESDARARLRAKRILQKAKKLRKSP